MRSQGLEQLATATEAFWEMHTRPWPGAEGLSLARSEGQALLPEHHAQQAGTVSILHLTHSMWGSRRAGPVRSGHHLNISRMSD